MELNMPTYPRLIKLFYTYLKFYGSNKNLLLVSYVIGKEIRLTLKDLSCILKVEWIGIKHFSKCTSVNINVYDQFKIIFGNNPNRNLSPIPPTKHLNTTMYLLHLMVVHVILQKEGHFYDLSFLDVFIMACIKTSRKLNLAYLIMRNMKKVLQTSRNLPYRTVLYFDL